MRYYKTNYYTVLNELRKLGIGKRHDISETLQSVGEKAQISQLLSAMLMDGNVRLPSSWATIEPIYSVKVEITSGGIEHLDKLENSRRSKWAIWISIGSLIVAIIAAIISLRKESTTQPQLPQAEIKKQQGNDTVRHKNETTHKDSIKQS